MMRPFLALFAGLTLGAAAQRNNEAGVTGYVLTPDRAPVNAGTVVAMRSPAGRVATAIDQSGRFRIVPDQPGSHLIHVIVPGFAPYRVKVEVPQSRTIDLPEIILAPATYFRARFVTASGEPIFSPVLRRQVFDVDGVTLADPEEARGADHIESDGTITIGPLHRGVTTAALDMPVFAQWRLPDLVVNGKDPLLDGGTITIDTGSVLNVDIVDGNGAAVPQHEVWIEDAAPRSPLRFRPVRTDAKGRAVFDRLGPARYRVWTKTIDRCGLQPPLVLARPVTVSGGGAERMRIVIGGRASFRVTSPVGPVAGKTVWGSPETGASSAPPWEPWFNDLPIARRPDPKQGTPRCGRATDADGRVTLDVLPPGPARVEIRLFNSTYVRRMNIPEDGRELSIAIPDGLISVHVTNAVTNQPVGLANVAWIGGGGRIEALASANGDALLEGMGAAGGTLAVSARGYESVEGAFTEPPGTAQEVALLPDPPSLLMARIVSAAGQPIPNAVVELLPSGSMDVSRIAAAGSNGVVAFPDTPRGTLRLTARADGFKPATQQVDEDARATITITLEPVTVK